MWNFLTVNFEAALLWRPCKCQLCFWSAAGQKEGEKGRLIKGDGVKKKSDGPRSGIEKLAVVEELFAVIHVCFLVADSNRTYVK